MPVDPSAPVEAWERFPCFGSTCTVLVSGAGPAGAAAEAAALARRRLIEWHQQFSRFEPGSELSLLNRDARSTVPVSPMMLRFIEAALSMARVTSGLVDPTMVEEVRCAGYCKDLKAGQLPLGLALSLAPPRQPANPSPAARWQQITLQGDAVSRPPGVQLDSGGVAKGLFGDVLGWTLEGHGSYAVEAAGDVRIGGTARLLRPVRVASPFDEGTLHIFGLSRGAAATSGIGRRSWLDRYGRPAHHLLDPRSGRPAFTGIVQATALAPSGLEAEALAKAALLSGIDKAPNWLPHGGLLVYDNGQHDVIEPSMSELPEVVRKATRAPA